MFIRYVNASLAITLTLFQALRLFFDFESWFIILPIIFVQNATTLYQIKQNGTVFRVSLTLVAYLLSVLVGSIATFQKMRVFSQCVGLLLCAKYAYDLFQANKYQEDVQKLILVRDETAQPGPRQ